MTRSEGPIHVPPGRQAVNNRTDARTRAAVEAEGRQHAGGVPRSKAQAVARALCGVGAPAVQRRLDGREGGVCGRRKTGRCTWGVGELDGITEHRQHNTVCMCSGLQATRQRHTIWTPPARALTAADGKLVASTHVLHQVFQLLRMHMGDGECSSRGSKQQQAVLQFIVLAAPAPKVS